VLNRPVGCLGGCLLPIALLFVVIDVMKYILIARDVSGLEFALVVISALIVLGIAFYGSHSHWTA
jgi:hypothetical protein